MDCFVAALLAMTTVAIRSEGLTVFRAEYPEASRMRGNVFEAIFEMNPLIRRRVFFD